MPDVPFGTFFLPGPTEVRPEVLAAMTRPMIPHRGKAFEAMFARIQAGLRDVFRTTRPVLVSSSSATGLMEAAVRCAPPGPILSVVNGAFSERFANIATACERQTDILTVPLGRAVDLAELELRLTARRYAAVTLVHSETSTGALSDVRGATAIARRHGALCLVDSVTGVAGSPLPFDEWSMDFVLTGSQKALALPPGLAVGVASAEYMRTAKEAKGRGLYFDLVEFETYAAKNQTPNTPALPLLYALDVQLERIAAETMEARWARHAAMSKQTWEWVDDVARRRGWPIRVLAPGGERSATVTAVTTPPGVSGVAVAAAVAKRGFVVGAGYGKLRETTFRVGHMGDHTTDRLALCLDACEEALGALVGR
ncbi:MAG: pyridoxal-phosphate-dependent aminotransferase family protein [Gemmatimonadaceae bacterium]